MFYKCPHCQLGSSSVGCIGGESSSEDSGGDDS
jgi:hypothetical protein